MNRNIKFVIVLLITLLVSFLLSLSLGNDNVPFSNILKYLFTFDAGVSFTLHELRAPRVFMAIAAGASMGLSGLIMQNIIKNPLASPDVLGISTGGALAVVICISFFSDIPSTYYSLVSILGSTLVLLLIVVFSVTSKVNTLRFILIGIILNTTCSSIIMILLIISDTHSASSSYHWLIGTLYSSTWDSVIVVSIVSFISMLLLILASHHMDLYEMTEDTSRGLGLNIQKYRVLFILIAVVLCAVPVSYIGTIGFTGLIAPHISRLIVGRHHTILIPSTAIVGAIIMLLSDTVGRVIFAPIDLPTGIVVAVVGGPFFLYLLFTTKKI